MILPTTGEDGVVPRDEPLAQVPADPAGAVATIVVALLETMAAATAPNFTPVALERLVPVMVTLVPPPVGPEVGLTELTTGPAL